jgi:uncharacterized protein
MVCSGDMEMAEKGQCGKLHRDVLSILRAAIDTPESREDYDDIRWYLCHEDVSVFVEDGDWYLSVKNKCRHLSEKDYRCRIYDRRPKICRKYKHADCDFVEGEYDYELHFTSDKDMEEYIR